MTTCNRLLNSQTGEKCQQIVNAETPEGIEGSVPTEIFICMVCDLTDDGRSDLERDGWMKGYKA